MKNYTTLFLTLSLLLVSVLGCSQLTGTANQSVETNAAKPANKTDAPAKTDSKQTKVEKADFTMTSEQYDAEFHKKGVKSADLEKYSNKIIQVTGRVSTLVTEKSGTTQPWVTLFAPGILHGVSCYFDDADVEQMKKLTKDKIATVQGLQGSLLVPEVSPMIDHCVVVEAN